MYVGLRNLKSIQDPTNGCRTNTTQKKRVEDNMLTRYLSLPPPTILPWGIQDVFPNCVCLWRADMELATAFLEFTDEQFRKV
jgi:hypothetical protein